MIKNLDAVTRRALIESAEETVRQNVGKPGVEIFHAQVLTLRLEFAEAEKTLRDYIARSDDGLAMIELARLYREMGNDEDALSVLRQAESSSNAAAMSLVEQAQIYASRKRPLEALNLLVRATDVIGHDDDYMAAAEIVALYRRLLKQGHSWPVGEPPPHELIGRRFPAWNAYLNHVWDSAADDPS